MAAQPTHAPATTPPAPSPTAPGPPRHPADGALPPVVASASAPTPASAPGPEVGS